MNELSLDTLDYMAFKQNHKEVVVLIKEKKILLGRPHNIDSAPNAQRNLIQLKEWAHTYCVLVAYIRGKSHSNSLPSKEDQLRYILDMQYFWRSYIKI